MGTALRPAVEMKINIQNRNSEMIKNIYSTRFGLFIVLSSSSGTVHYERTIRIRRGLLSFYFRWTSALRETPVRYSLYYVVERMANYQCDCKPRSSVAVKMFFFFKITFRRVERNY